LTSLLGGAANLLGGAANFANSSSFFDPMAAEGGKKII